MKGIHNPWFSNPSIRITINISCFMRSSSERERERALIPTLHIYEQGADVAPVPRKVFLPPLFQIRSWGLSWLALPGVVDRHPP